MGKELDDVTGGSGTCKYCNEHVSNVSYHESNHCRKNPLLKERWEKHDAEMARRILPNGSGGIAPQPKMYEFNFHDHLVYLLIEFDFERVVETMKKLDWKWVLGEDLQFPTVKELQYSAVSTLNNAYEYALKSSDKTGRSECGGLAGTVNIPDDYVRLEFIVESKGSFESYE